MLRKTLATSTLWKRSPSLFLSSCAPYAVRAPYLPHSTQQQQQQRQPYDDLATFSTSCCMMALVSKRATVKPQHSKNKNITRLENEEQKKHLKKTPQFFEGEQRWIHFTFQDAMTVSPSAETTTTTKTVVPTPQNKIKKFSSKTKHLIKDNDDDDDDENDEGTSSSVTLKKKNNLRADKLLGEQLNLSREYVDFLFENRHVRLVPREQQQKLFATTTDGQQQGGEKTVVQFDMTRHESDSRFFVDKKSLARRCKAGDLVFVYLQQRHLPSERVQQRDEDSVTSATTDRSSTEAFSEKPLVHIDEKSVIYEDDHVIVVNKPHGYAVHVSVGHAPHTTMLYAIRDYVARKEAATDKKKDVKNAEKAKENEEEEVEQEEVEEEQEHEEEEDENETEGTALNKTGTSKKLTTKTKKTKKTLKKKKKKTSTVKAHKNKTETSVPKLPTFVNLVHRLDKETSGVLICGKNSYSVQHLNRQFMEKTVNDDEKLAKKQQITKKVYCAICVVPRVDKFLELLQPITVTDSVAASGANLPKDPAWMDETFDLSDFAIEVPGEGRRSLTQADLDKFSEQYETEEDMRDDVEEDDGDELVADNDDQPLDEDYENEEDLERAILREEQKFDDEIEEIIARAHLTAEEEKDPIPRNQMIIVNKPITVLQKSHRHHSAQDGAGMYAVRYSIEQEGVEEGTGEELLLQKQMKKSKSAKSVIRVVEVNKQKQLALVLVSIKSGRTHQIRSHLTSIGAPVLGDRAYYDLLDNRIALAVDRRVRPRRMMLHCMRMRFMHPFKDTAVQCFAPVQDEMLQIIQKHFTEESVNEVLGSVSTQ